MYKLKIINILYFVYYCMCVLSVVNKPSVHGVDTANDLNTNTEITSNIPKGLQHV